MTATVDHFRADCRVRVRARADLHEKLTREIEYSGDEAFDNGEYFDLPGLKHPASIVAWLIVIAAFVVWLLR